MDIRHTFIYAIKWDYYSKRSGLSERKKELHIYESTFSDILGIMMFSYLIGGLNPAEDIGIEGFAANFVLTGVIRTHCQLCHYPDFLAN